MPGIISVRQAYTVPMQVPHSFASLGHCMWLASNICLRLCPREWQHRHEFAHAFLCE